MINKFINLEELNLLVVLHVLMNQSYNNKIAEVDIKKSERKGSELSIKESMISKWQEVKRRKVVKNTTVEEKLKVVMIIIASNWKIKTTTWL